MEDLDKIQQLEKKIKELENNLIHDKLTGLKTRAFFEEEISTYLEIIRQQRELIQSGDTSRREYFGFSNLSIIFFDIDHFKLVNDKYGHEVGDLVLVKVANTIRSSLRTGDTVARWGGEEMVTSLLGANEQDALTKAEEIRDNVANLSFPEAPELKITLSAGVTASDGEVDLTHLVRNADQAMYKAKESGRNKVLEFSQI
ncbi:GGDEF domain-containing protein [Candidatus Parcubacteria bacterium]|nr:GGDEF domain-containing protein [Candidatus Parcubacteria bacterium]